MAKSKKILSLMREHHDFIDAFFADFKNNLGKEESLVKKLLENFRWEFQKHLFIEEEVVFRICDSLESELCSTIQGLADEHDTMLKTLNSIEQNLPKVKESDISLFQEILAAHKGIEERNLYPELDKVLNKKQKEVMLSRIVGVPIKRHAKGI